MKKRKWNRVLSVLLVMVTVISLMSGCGKKSAKNEEKDTITVYLWSTKLYEKYAPYIQKQLPDINIEFVVGNNDLDFYRFLKENGGLPDIITCCRFSLHDANPLKDSLMDLSTCAFSSIMEMSWFSPLNSSTSVEPILPHPTMIIFIFYPQFINTFLTNFYTFFIIFTKMKTIKKLEVII